MAWLESFGWGKVALILALFAALFVIRLVSGGRPELGPARRRRRRRIDGS
ncbi:MAG: hypothetical protein JST54_02715 [Deltaproteobacteria bacterium]|nr:hypothetical protein [Deltaproteobacteria bacterium]